MSEAEDGSCKSSDALCGKSWQEQWPGVEDVLDAQECAPSRCQGIGGAEVESRVVAGVAFDRACAGGEFVEAPASAQGVAEIDAELSEGAYGEPGIDYVARAVDRRC